MKDVFFFLHSLKGQGHPQESSRALCPVLPAPAVALSFLIFACLPVGPAAMCFWSFPSSVSFEDSMLATARWCYLLARLAKLKLPSFCNESKDLSLWANTDWFFFSHVAKYYKNIQFSNSPLGISHENIRIISIHVTNVVACAKYVSCYNVCNPHYLWGTCYPCIWRRFHIDQQYILQTERTYIKIHAICQHGIYIYKMREDKQVKA